jgi:hypothetical protein
VRTGGEEFHVLGVTFPVERTSIRKQRHECGSPALLFSLEQLTVEQ